MKSYGQYSSVINISLSFEKITRLEFNVEKHAAFEFIYFNGDKFKLNNIIFYVLFRQYILIYEFD